MTRWRWSPARRLFEWGHRGDPGLYMLVFERQDGTWSGRAFDPEWGNGPYIEINGWRDRHRCRDALRQLVNETGRAR